eukprot:gene15964-33606_t
MRIMRQNGRVVLQHEVTPGFTITSLKDIIDDLSGAADNVVERQVEAELVTYYQAVEEIPAESARLKFPALSTELFRWIRLLYPDAYDHSEEANLVYRCCATACVNVYGSCSAPSRFDVDWEGSETVRYRFRFETARAVGGSLRSLGLCVLWDLIVESAVVMISIILRPILVTSVFQTRLFMTSVGYDHSRILLGLLAWVQYGRLLQLHVTRSFFYPPYTFPSSVTGCNEEDVATAINAETARLQSVSDKDEVAPPQ